VIGDTLHEPVERVPVPPVVFAYTGIVLLTTIENIPMSTGSLEQKNSKYYHQLRVVVPVLPGSTGTPRAGYSYS
jgi:hypothetical protein